MTEAASPSAKRRDRQIVLVAAVVVVQAVAAVFFVADALGDAAEDGLTGIS